MAVPTPSSISTPLTDTKQAVNHEKVLGPSTTSILPSHYTPVPVAALLPGGTTGTVYSETISAQGGTSPYTFAVTSGALPTGTSLNSSTGAITGTPSATGTFNFTITVTDVNGYTGSEAFTIVVSAPASSGGGSYMFIA